MFLQYSVVTGGYFKTGIFPHIHSLIQENPFNTKQMYCSCVKFLFLLVQCCSTEELIANKIQSSMGSM